MSGTSLDGIDVALLETDAENFIRPGPFASIAYRPEERRILREALNEAWRWRMGEPMPALLSEAERILTQAHIAVVMRFLADYRLTPADIGLIGFHGQTVLHQPERRRTVQLGTGEALAQATGIDVVCDFRSADVAAGGQGAPFAPLYHAALVRAAGALSKPICVVNIGGVANVTWIGPSRKDEDGDRQILAFDTGPGNALLDDWMLTYTGQPLDRDGALAQTGQVDQAVLARLLDNPYFDVPPPKSLDRLSFSAATADGLSPADGAATLTAFTAAALARAAGHVPAAPGRWIICGGGRHNLALMAELRRRLSGEVRTAEEMGWQGDALEAQAFAYLAVRSQRGLPLSLPGTTGVPAPQTGGWLCRA